MIALFTYNILRFISLKLLVGIFKYPSTGTGVVAFVTFKQKGLLTFSCTLQFI